MGGWYLCSDLYDMNEDWTPQVIFNVVALNDKQRFQLAAHTVDNRGTDTRRLVTKIYAIRCTSGHSIAVDPKLLSTPLTADKAEHVAATTHSTQSFHLASIFRHGLHPGGVNGMRNASNFNAFLPNDPRNVVEGRKGSELDAVIVYVMDTLLEAKPMTISHNGVIA
eukprot:16437776-Heterocapsa_arctica.AAC.1